MTEQYSTLCPQKPKYNKRLDWSVCSTNTLCLERHGDYEDRGTVFSRGLHCHCKGTAEDNGRYPQYMEVAEPLVHFVMHTLHSSRELIWGRKLGCIKVLPQFLLGNLEQRAGVLGTPSVPEIILFFYHIASGKLLGHPRCILESRIDVPHHVTPWSSSLGFWKPFSLLHRNTRCP